MKQIWIEYMWWTRRCFVMRLTGWTLRTFATPPAELECPCCTFKVWCLLNRISAGESCVIFLCLCTRVSPDWQRRREFRAMGRISLLWDLKKLPFIRRGCGLYWVPWDTFFLKGQIHSEMLFILLNSHFNSTLQHCAMFHASSIGRK